MDLLRGAPDGQRRRRAPTTCSRASSRTSTRATRRCAGTAWSARAAGTATGCRSRSRWNRSSGSQQGTRSRTHRDRGVQRDSAASRCSRTSRSGTGSPNASASGSTSRTPTARSTRPTSSRCGGRSRRCTGGGCSTRVTRSCPTATAAAPRSPRTRSRSAIRTSSIPSVVRRAAASSAREENAARLDDHAMDAARQRRGRGRGRIEYCARARTPTRCWCSPRRLPSGCSARTPSPRQLPGRGAGGRSATRARSSRSRPRAAVRSPVARGRLRDDRGRHRDRAHRARLRRRRLQRRRRERPPSTRRPHGLQPGRARRHLRRARASATARSYAGRMSRTPSSTEELIADLDARGLLLRRESYEHSYPHCWRCGTPLIYYAKASWYIATRGCATQLLAENETVAWHPPHVKHGRFGEWLKGNVDWALSRERYWGTPLPIWRCAGGHVQRDRLLRGARARSRARRSRTTTGPTSTRSSSTAPECGEPMRRVPEVIDVWFDSGAMPFAQHHAPFENEERFARALPGGLRLRGARPDARLVLLAARDLHAPVRRRRPTATSSASG